MEKFTKHFIFWVGLIVVVIGAFMAGLNSARADIANAVVWSIITLFLILALYIIYLYFSQHNNSHIDPHNDPR